MPLLTGTLLDFSTTVLGSNPRIVFSPSEAATYNPGSVGYLFATKRIVVTPEPDGTFEVFLFTNALGRPATYYTMTIEWDGYLGADFPKWKIRVGETGGALIDYIETPWNPTLAWWGPEPPTGTPVPSTLWLDTDTPNNDLLIWSA